jgi:hypothetical protein
VPQATQSSVQLLCPSSGQRHWLAASLTPEGGRTFTIDGKAKSGVQVKVRVRACVGRSEERARPAWRTPCKHRC